MKRLLLFALPALIIVLVAIDWTAPKAFAEGPAVKIGINIELSGKQSAYGLPIARALKFAVEKKNAAGGIKSLNGAKIELVGFDNATEVTAATSNAERLGSDPKILVTYGPCTSALSMAVEPITGKWKVPNMFIFTTADSIFEHGNPYIVSVTIMASKLGATYAEFMVFMHDKFKVPLNRITLAYPDDDYGKDLTKVFKETLAKKGYGKNIVADISFDWLAKDLTPLVLKIKGANPDFHLQVARTADGKLYHDACFTQRFHPYQVGGTSGFNHPDLWKLLGEKIASDTIGNPKLFFMELGAFDLPNLERDAWVKEFHAKYPDIPIEQNLYLGGTAANFLIEALEKAGKADREAINQALHRISLKKDDPFDFCGAFETPGLAFTPEGKANAWPVIGEWRKVEGQWRKVSLWHLTKGIFNTPKGFRK